MGKQYDASLFILTESAMSQQTRFHACWTVLALVLAVPTSAEQLPEGNTGIAARYPGDAGIASDPAVIFTDDFESYSSAAGLTARWNQAYHSANLRIAGEPGNFFRGAKALELTLPKQSSEVANQVIKAVTPTRDILFLRYYAKFDTAFNIMNSSNNGMEITSNYCCPGVPADGYNKFAVSYEASRWDTTTANPGKLNVYVYYPEQRDIWGDHFYPTGIVLPYSSMPGNFGPTFVARQDVIPELGRWYSYELMVKANTPGQRDGRIAMWLDGSLIADFPNLRLRDTTALKIDRFLLDFHAGSNSFGVAKKWCDNVVAATSYIGPLSAGQSTLRPPGNLRLVP